MAAKINNNDVRFIFTADDYGPVPFINKGILHHVRKGSINSVHVLVNFEYSELIKSLEELWDAVPAGKTLDLGAHLTLTSGKPLYKGDSSDDKIKNFWGNLISKSKQEYYFRDYKNFFLRYVNHLNYAIYGRSISLELQMQIDTLIKAVMQVNTTKNGNRLKVTSVSNHHNIFTIHEDLFERYVLAAQKYNLAIRSPKMIPKSKAQKLYKTVLPITSPVFSSVELNKNMNQLFVAFSINSYIGSSTLILKSPSYIDITLYMDLGSLSVINKEQPKKVNELIKEFIKVVDFAKSGYKKVSEDSASPLKVETVFHLGMFSEAENRKFTKTLGNGYSGITHKYFNNRTYEFDALEIIRNNQNGAYKELSSVFDNLTSWDECGDVKFIKM